MKKSIAWLKRSSYRCTVWRYNVNKKVAHARAAEACFGVMTSSVYLKLNKQRQNVIYSFYIIKFFFPKLSLVVQPHPVVRPKDFRTPFFVIMIYTKQSTPLAVDKAEMAVVGLSLKWRQPWVCPLIDHGSRPIRSLKELWLFYKSWLYNL